MGMGNGVADNNNATVLLKMLCRLTLAVVPVAMVAVPVVGAILMVWLLQIFVVNPTLAQPQLWFLALGGTLMGWGYQYPCP